MKIKISIILLVLLLLSGCGTGKKSISHSLLSLDEFNNRFIFPERLGQLKKVDITNYEKDHPGGGYSVIYESSNTRLDIFAYDQRIVDIPPDIRSELVVNEFKYSANAVFEMVKRENYKNITSSKGRYVSLHDHDFWIAEFEFTVNGLDRYSILALTVHRQKFFKLRITTLKDKSISYKNIVNELIDEVIWKILKIEETDQNILLSQGVVFIEGGQYDRAIAYYNKAIELNPGLAMAYYYRGIAYAKKDQYDKANTDYSKAIELNPRLAEAYSNRGITYDTKGQYDKAITDYSKAIELNPGLAQAYNNRGLTYANNGQYDKAITDYNKAIEINPRDAKAYSNRGLAHVKKGQYDKAITDYSKAIEINPRFATAYCIRGLAYVKKGQYDKAITDYGKAIELNPGIAEYYSKRGVAYFIKGQYERVISDYSKAIEINPNIIGCYINRGLAYHDTGQYDLAITDYNKALELNPKNDMAYNSLAWLYATAKEETFRSGQMAIEYAIKSLSVEITSGRLDTLAAAYAENGDFTNAVMTEKEALKICSNQEAKKEIEELIKAYQARKTYVQYKYGEQLENR